MTWNIWNIKSRTLRAIVAWLFAALAAVVVLVALVPALVWLAVTGVVTGLRYAWNDNDWRELAGYWRKAATGKEAV